MQATLRTWLPALAGMTCLGLSAGLIGIFGFFIQPVSAEFGVSVAALNMAPAAFLLVPGLLSPVVGLLVDRLPARRLLLAGSVLAMASLFMVSRAPTPFWAAVAFLGFALGFVFYGPLTINGLMVKLYPGREGRALAITAMGTSVASVSLPLFVGSTLQYFDWRTTLGALSIGMLLVIWLWVFAGIPAGAGGSLGESSHRVTRDIYRRPEFWLVGIIVALALNALLVLTICYPPLFAQRGFTAVQAGLFLSLGGIGGALGKLGVAVVVDKFSAFTRLAAAAILLLSVLAMLLLLHAVSTAAVALSVFFLGMSGGALLPMHPYVNSRYFDAAVIGQVSGAQAPLFLPLGLVGPPLAGYVFDRTGSYDLVLMGLIALLVSAVLMVFLLPRTR